MTSLPTLGPSVARSRIITGAMYRSTEKVRPAPAIPSLKYKAFQLVLANASAGLTIADATTASSAWSALW